METHFIFTTFLTKPSVKIWCLINQIFSSKNQRTHVTQGNKCASFWPPASVWSSWLYPASVASLSFSYRWPLDHLKFLCHELSVEAMDTTFKKYSVSLVSPEYFRSMCSSIIMRMTYMQIFFHKNWRLDRDHENYSQFIFLFLCWLKQTVKLIPVKTTLNVSCNYTVQQCHLRFVLLNYKWFFHCQLLICSPIKEKFYDWWLYK